MSDRGNNVSNIHESMVGDRSGHDVVKLISGVGRAIQVNHAFRVRDLKKDSGHSMLGFSDSVHYGSAHAHISARPSRSLAIYHESGKGTTSVHVAHTGVAEIADD